MANLMLIECPECGGEGEKHECFDGFCEDAEIGCDDCICSCSFCGGKGGLMVPTDSELAADAMGLPPDQRS